MKYKQQKDGDRLEFNPAGDIWRIACCDCGLVHDVALAIEKNGKIGIAIEQNKRATGQKRRWNNYK